MERRWCRWCVASLFALAGQAQAQDEALSFRGALRWQNSVIMTQRAKSYYLNPDNRVLHLPESRFVTELRPDLRLSAKDLQLIGRPRLRYDYNQRQVGATRETPRTTHKAFWNEAFMQWTVSDSLTLAWGRQNFQWGAAEVASPSNRIFRETVTSRNLLTEPEGLNVVRLNISAGRSFSLVAMAEYEENRDRAPSRAGELFQSRGLLKPEFNWNNGSDYIGLVLGGREHGQGWLGEYVNVGVPGIDGLAFYADASHERGSDAWYPVVETLPTPMGPMERIVYEQRAAESSKVLTYAVAGLRYDFADGAAVRAEYVWHEAGYDRQDWQRQKRAFTDAAPAQLAVREQATARAVLNGLDLPGQRYGFFSLAWPDLFTKDLMMSWRSLFSASDASSSHYLAIEYNLTGGGTVYTAQLAQAGADDSELVRGVRSQHIIGYRHAW